MKGLGNVFLVCGGLLACNPIIALLTGYPIVGYVVALSVGCICSGIFFRIKGSRKEAQKDA